MHRSREAFAKVDWLSSRIHSFVTEQSILDKVSVLYVFAPVALWAYGWLRIYIAIPLIAMIIWGAYQSARRAPFSPDLGQPDETESRAHTFWLFQHGMLFLFAVCTVIATGWGLGFKNSDFTKHEMFLRDLTDFRWPLGYQNMGKDGQPGVLTAYLSFYLVPALLGKLAASWSVAWYSAAAWIVLGTYLTFCWIMRCLGVTVVWAACFFMFFGGLDVLGWLMFPSQLIRGDILIEWWHLSVQTFLARNGSNVVFWAYGDNLITQAWSPHHILPGWIVLFMCLSDLLRIRTSGRTLFMASAVPLSSFFCAVGLFPFVLAAIALNRAKGLLTAQNLLIGPIIVVLSALYMASNRGDVPIGPLWQYQDVNSSWIILLLFYAIEFGIYWGVCWIGGLRPASRQMRVLGHVAVGILLFLPWCVFGTYSELVVKGAIPALAVLILYFTTVLIDSAADANLAQARRLLIAVLAVGYLGALSHLQSTFRQNGGFTQPVPDATKLDRLNTGFPIVLEQTRAQLMSDGTSFFWRHLAKPPVIQD